jgi:hypothetical protein
MRPVWLLLRLHVALLALPEPPRGRLIHWGC